MNTTLQTMDCVSAKAAERRTAEPALPQVADRPPVADWTDEQLLLHFRQSGSRECFEQLVQRYERELYNYLRRYLGSSEMAEDAFQATFLQLYMKCQTFEEGRRVRPWLYAIAVNQAIDAQRRQRRQRMISLDRVHGQHQGTPFEARRFADAMVSEEPSPWLEAAASERCDMMTEALSQLTEQMRVAVDLVYYQGLKYREAAEVMKVPVGTVKSRVHAAVAKLTEFWNEHATDLD